MRAIPLVPTVFILSVLIIGGALFFEYGIGLIPCELCLLERWPWYAAIIVSGVLLVLHPPSMARAAAILFIALFVGSSGIAFYHVGVEQHFFAGPTACTAAPLSGHSAEDLLKSLQATPVVRCDEPQWSLFGISLAGWNLVASVLMLVLCGLGRRRATAAEATA
jgi:disulfide bond formation protein DsbB